MTSDLHGETGAPDPGLDRLFSTLTAAGTSAELAGEQDALAMFRANARPPATPAPAGRRVHALRFPARWSVRLGAVAAAMAVSGAAAAAYAAVLPQPVQHLAHNVLGFAGVPDIHRPGPARGMRHHHARSGHHGSAPVVALPTPTAAMPSGSAAGPTGPASASPTNSLGTGLLQLSAVATSPHITAGVSVTIDGRLSRRGAGMTGVTVWLVERPAGQRRWHVAGSGQTTTDGNVAVSVPALTQNAVFRLMIPNAAVSRSVLVTVSPPMTAVLSTGSAAAPGTLLVSAEYARAGDVVVLEVQGLAGSWRQLNFLRLSTTGQATFHLPSTWHRNRVVRVVLLATARHAAAVSNTVAVPPS